MITTAHNVYSIGFGEVYGEICEFLKEKGYQSEATRIAYENDIKMFFKIIKNKDIQALTIDDIQIKRKDIMKFISIMVESNEYSNSTINRRVASIISLLRHFHGTEEKMVKDISFIEGKTIPRLPENNREHGILTIDEVFDFANWVRENERELSEEKYYFILLSLDTCLRKNAILQMEWSDFEVIDNKVYVNTVDKGNKDFRSEISIDFYNDLNTLRRDNDNKVFSISSSAIQNMLNRYKKARNIPSNRRIVIHSIRKAGATYQYRITGDILQAKKALGHSNLSTTQKYIGTEDYGAIGVVSRGMNVDDDLYKKVSREDLERAIESISGYKNLLNVKLNEILSK